MTQPPMPEHPTPQPAAQQPLAPQPSAPQPSAPQPGLDAYGPGRRGADPLPGETVEAPAKRRIGGIAVATAVFGGIVLFGLAVTGILDTVSTSLRSGGQTNLVSTSATVDTSGVTDLDIEIGRASLALEFGDVTEASLDTTGGNGRPWALQRDGDTLEIRAPESRDYRGGFCILGWCPADRGITATATLTLPRELAGTLRETEVSVGAGEVTLDGELGDLDIEIGAGDVTVSGSARALDASVGVGTLTGTLTGVASAAIDVSMGDADLELRGSPPRNVDLNVSVGSIDLRVAPGNYAVAATGELGNIDNRLQNSAGAPSRISANASLGDITLRELR